MSRLWSVMVLLLVGLVVAGCDTDQSDSTQSAGSLQLTETDIAQNNRGVALMGYFDYPGARQTFAEIVERHPDWLEARVNLAIATLNRQQEGDEARALALVSNVLVRDPGNVRAHYVSGLLNLYLGEAEKAEKHFRAVVIAAPKDAYAAYYLGQVLVQSGRVEEALPEYATAMRLDPYLRSAYYGAALAMRRVGRADEAAALLSDYQRFENNPRARLAEFKYTRMGPLAETLAVNQSTDPREPRTVEKLFDAPIELAQLTGPGPRSTLTTVDIDDDGDQDLFATRIGESETNSLLLQDEAGGFAAAEHALDAVDLVNAAAWGDMDNDGLVDVYFCRDGANQYWQQQSPGVWVEKTAETGTANAAFDCADVLLVDADHDGDLDIFIANRDGPNELFNNNLNGSFRPLAQDYSLAGRVGSRGLIATDLDNDRDVDLIVIKTHPPHEVFINDRLWQYRLEVPTQGWAQSAIAAAIAADLDGDGFNEIVTTPAPTGFADAAQNSAATAVLANAGATAGNLDLNLTPEQLQAIATQAREVDRLLRNATRVELTDEARQVIESHPQLGPAFLHDDGGADDASYAGSVAELTDIGMSDGARADQDLPPADLLIASDFDGDGTPDLALFNEQSWSVRLPATDRLYAGDEVAVLAATILYTHADKGPALVTLSRTGQLTLYPQSADRHHYVAFEFTGKEEQADSMRSNRDGIGTRAALRVGSHWSIAENFDANSGAGQSRQPLMFGLGDAEQADFVALTWSDGVFQTELDLAAGTRHRIEETQRQLSSCPVLFAWDGERYRFITDLLGVGGVGFFVAPGVAAEPRPWEYLLLPPDSVAPLDGKLVFKLTEPMEEVAYLDSARLHIYDLPPGLNMVMDDRMVIAGPPASGEPLFYLDELLPLQAINDRGKDVTASVQAADLVAAPVGELDRRFIGRLNKPNVLTLSFSEALERRGDRPVLIVDGWVEYPYSQTVFAAWQADADYSAPTLEAYGRDGEWRIIAANFGYPAGMPRKMALPLDNLPAGTMRLRLTTNLEVYWDRISIGYAVDFVPNHQSLEPVSARQRRNGFPRRTTAAQRLPSYDYTEREAFWDTRYMRGSYSAFGPVTELVAATDDAVAIIGPGEEVELKFDAPAYDPPTAWTRHFVLEVRGWAKDMDLYTRDGDTLEPLPVRVPGSDTTWRDRLHERYHTRYQAGY